MRPVLLQRKLHIVAFFLVIFIIVLFFNHQENSPKKENNEEFGDKTILIYNRIPKTGSTSLMHLAYELCLKNKFNTVLMNITSPSSHSMTFRDRLFFSNNVTQWSEKLPAIYHGHFAFFDVEKLAEDKTKNIIFINVIRKPLDRLVSYYYFLRYGDDYRVNKIRSRNGNTQTFDECVEKQQPDCDPKRIWMQVPWFCGHHQRCWEPPGNSWALEQAKRNLVNKYFLVGLTEELDSFVDMLESVLPRFFKGAGHTFRTNDKLRHVRKTKHKDPLSNSTIDQIKSSKIWRKEQEFYDFAEAQFRSLKEDILKTTAGRTDFHYEKIRPAHKEEEP